MKHGSTTTLTLRGMETTMRTIADLKSHPRFAELREKVEQAGSDSLDTFGGKFAGGYHVQQHPDEFGALLCFLLERCRPIGLYGEIGVAAGGTTRLIYEAVGFEKAVLIDDGSHPKHRFFPENTAALRHVHFIKGDSHSQYVADALRNGMSDGTAFDVAFIDGDHVYEGVKQDIELVRPYCTPATLLIFHDTVCCPGVHDAFGELEHKVAEFVGDKQLGIGVARLGA
jgi:cephalosporin hydroxylase